MQKTSAERDGESRGDNWQRDVMFFSPQHHGTDSLSWGPARARLIVEESDRRSSTAPLRATLVQSTQEHHLRKWQGRVRADYRLLGNNSEGEDTSCGFLLCALCCWTAVCVLMLCFGGWQNQRGTREKTLPPIYFNIKVVMNVIERRVCDWQRLDNRKLCADARMCLLEFHFCFFYYILTCYNGQVKYEEVTTVKIHFDSDVANNKDIYSW